MNLDTKEDKDLLVAGTLELNEFITQMRAKCPTGAQLQIHNESEGSFMAVSVFHWIPETDQEAAERLKAPEISKDASDRH